MEIEAALVLPYIRLNNLIQRYAFRALKLSLHHPIPGEIAKISPEINKTNQFYDKYNENKLVIINYHKTLADNRIIYPQPKPPLGIRGSDNTTSYNTNPGFQLFNNNLYAKTAKVNARNTSPNEYA
jgi:hypothetical protein